LVIEGLVLGTREDARLVAHIKECIDCWLEYLEVKSDLDMVGHQFDD
jgi:hypothetical protein